MLSTVSWPGLLRLSAIANGDVVGGRAKPRHDTGVLA
jgi:hypothetical protein